MTDLTVTGNLTVDGNIFLQTSLFIKDSVRLGPVHFEGEVILRDALLTGGDFRAHAATVAGDTTAKFDTSIDGDFVVQDMWPDDVLFYLYATQANTTSYPVQLPVMEPDGSSRAIATSGASAANATNASDRYSLKIAQPSNTTILKDGIYDVTMCVVFKTRPAQSGTFFLLFVTSDGIVRSQSAYANTDSWAGVNLRFQSRLSAGEEIAPYMAASYAFAPTEGLDIHNCIMDISYISD